MSYYLLRKGNYETPFKIPLNGIEVVVGRSSYSELSTAPFISRRHASFISSSDGQWFVTDLNSTNGVFVNGNRVGRPLHCIKIGDSIGLGVAQATADNEFEFIMKLDVKIEEEEDDDDVIILEEFPVSRRTEPVVKIKTEKSRSREPEFSDIIKNQPSVLLIRDPYVESKYKEQYLSESSSHKRVSNEQEKHPKKARIENCNAVRTSSSESDVETSIKRNLSSVKKKKLRFKKVIIESSDSSCEESDANISPSLSCVKQVDNNVQNNVELPKCPIFPPATTLSIKVENHVGNNIETDKSNDLPPPLSSLALKVNGDVHSNLKISDFAAMPPCPVQMKNPCLAAETPEHNVTVKKEIIEKEDDFEENFGYSQIEEVIVISDDDDYLNFPASQEVKDINLQHIKIEPIDCDYAEYDYNVEKINDNGSDEEPCSESVDAIRAFLNSKSCDDNAEVKKDHMKASAVNDVAQNQENHLDFFPVLSQNFYSGPDASPSEIVPCEDNETSCSSNSNNRNSLTKRKGAKSNTVVLTDPRPMQYRPRYQRGREEWFEERCGEDDSEKSVALPSKSITKKTAKLPKVKAQKLQHQKPTAEKKEKKEKNKKDIKERVKEMMGHRIRAPNGGSAIRPDSNKAKCSSDSVKKSTHKIPNKKTIPTTPAKTSKSVPKNAKSEKSSEKSQHYKLDRFSSRTNFLTVDTASTSGQKQSKAKTNSVNGFKIPKTKAAEQSASHQIKNHDKDTSEALRKSSSLPSAKKFTDVSLQKGERIKSSKNITQSNTKSGRNLDHVNSTSASDSSQLSHIPQKSSNYRSLVYPNLNHHANLAADAAKNGNNDTKKPDKLTINASPYYWQGSDYMNSASSSSHQAVNLQKPIIGTPWFKVTNHQTSVSSSNHIANITNSNNILPSFHTVNHQKSTEELASCQAADHQNANGVFSSYESLNHQNCKEVSQSCETITPQNSKEVLPIPSSSLNKDPRLQAHASKTSNTIGISSSSHGKGLCAVKPNNAGDPRKRIFEKPLWLDFDSVLAKVLYWAPRWLEEYKKRNNPLPPPVIIEGVAPLPTSFRSLNEYLRSFYPMILLELWEHIFQQWDQIEYTKMNEPERNVVYLMVTESISKGDIMVYDCESLVCSNAFFVPREGFLMIVNLLDETGKNFMKTFGYVTTHKVENISSTRLHPEWRRHPESQATNCLLYKFSMKTRKRPQKAAFKKIMKAYILCYITNSIRLADGLQHLSASQLTQDVLQPSEKTCKLNLKPWALPPEVIGKYSPIQTSVISSVTHEMKTSYMIPKIILLQGPPGTGKTHTILGIIQNLILDRHVKILVTAPSNAAIDEIGKRLLQVKRKRSGSTSMEIVRVGLPRQVHKEMIPYTVEKRAEKYSRRHDKFEIERLEKQLVEKRKFIKKLEHDLSMNLSREEYGTISNKLFMERRREMTCMDEIDRIQNRSRSNDPAMYADKLKILENANVVLSTLGSCRLKILEKVFGMRSKIHFTCCIIDEAAQCTEPEALQPVVFGLTKFVLVGDHCQLPATVLSKLAKESNYGRSWFHRMHLDFQKQNVDSPMFMLTEQYRMHPEICSFPSSYFYHKKLRTSPLMMNKFSFPLKPFIVLDIIEGQESNVQSSKENFHEARAIVAICNEIYRTFSNLSYSVGIITPYLGQKGLILQKFKENNYYSNNVEVNTVDSFQGREKDIIILSCVRARSVDGNIGFVECEHRLNVAITRAKHCLIICGHMKSLESRSHWRALIQDAKQRDVYVTMTSLDDVPFIISEMKLDLRLKKLPRNL